MGPGFESLKVHQEKRDAFLHLFFLATFVGGELLVRPIAKQWHEPRRGEVVPESLLLHSSFSLVALSGEEPHPNDKVGKNEMLFSDVGSLRRRRHEERSDEVVPESAHTPQGAYFVPVLSVRPAEGAAKNKASACPFIQTRPLSPRNFFCHANSSRRSKIVGEGCGRAGSSCAFERFMILSYSVENGRQNASNFSP